jgi:hypothetical protein
MSIVDISNRPMETPGKGLKYEHKKAVSLEDARNGKQNMIRKAGTEQEKQNL